MLDTGQLPLSNQDLQSYRQGLAAAANADYARAISHYESVLAVRPDFYEAWYERGLALEHRGSYIDAIASFDRALSLNPESILACEIWHDRGNAFQYGLGNYQEAVSCYDRTLELHPEHESAWQNRGNALLYGLEQAEAAILCYSRVLSINPENHLAWRNRGSALLELHRYEEAIANFDRALQLKPDDEIAWQARLQASEHSGLSYQQPTTNPAWYGSGYSISQPVDGESGATPDLSGSPPPVEDASTKTLGQPFLVVEDDWGEREILLDRDQYVIGRDPTCDICLHSRFASRHHAVLRRLPEPEQQVYQIVDGDLEGKPSTNGLLVNGHKQSEHVLEAEDEVVFGPQVRAIFRCSKGIL